MIPSSFSPNDFIWQRVGHRNSHSQLTTKISWRYSYDKPLEAFVWVICRTFPQKRTPRAGMPFSSWSSRCIWTIHLSVLLDIPEKVKGIIMYFFCHRRRVETETDNQCETICRVIRARIECEWNAFWEFKKTISIVRSTPLNQYTQKFVFSQSTLCVRSVSYSTRVDDVIRDINIVNGGISNQRWIKHWMRLGMPIKRILRQRRGLNGPPEAIAGKYEGARSF